ncbi:MAG: hypothetical protein WAO95_15880 [Burkholderiales bacterium]
MKLLCGSIPLAIILGLGAPATGAETITGAQYEAPVDRYGHFALGRPHEYARVRATTDAGRTLTLQLPEDEVFEDLAPRLVTLAPGEPRELLTIISGRKSGSRLAVIRLGRDRLEMGAQSPAIGTPMRWLNPVGVADFDGDGQVEIAAVVTPHIGGTLKVYRRTGSKLIEITSLAGFSNHIYGSPQLALSAPVSIDGRIYLLVPDAARLRLRVIALEGGRLFEVRRCALSAALTGAMRVIAPSEVSVDLRSGPQLIVLSDCLVSRVQGSERSPSAFNLAMVADAPQVPRHGSPSFAARRTSPRYA